MRRLAIAVAFGVALFGASSTANAALYYFSSATNPNVGARARFTFYDETQRLCGELSFNAGAAVSLEILDKDNGSVARALTLRGGGVSPMPLVDTVTIAERSHFGDWRLTLTTGDVLIGTSVFDDINIPGTCFDADGGILPPIGGADAGTHADAGADATAPESSDAGELGTPPPIVAAGEPPPAADDGCAAAPGPFPSAGLALAGLVALALVARRRPRR